MPADLLVALLGLLAGAAIGCTGVGAGSLLTPLLILVLHVRPATAVGTALAFSAVTRVAGAIQHLRQGTVDLRLVLWLAAGSVPLALLSLLAAPRLLGNGSQVSDATIRRLVGAALVLVAPVMTLRFAGWLPLRPTRPGPRPLAGVGGLLGASVALTSVGSGSLAIGILSLITSLATPALIGTDMVHAALLALVTTPFYLAHGQVDLRLAAALAVGALPGVVLGSRLVARVPERFLKATVLVAVWSIAIKLA